MNGWNEARRRLRRGRMLGALGGLLVILLAGCASGNGPNIGTANGGVGGVVSNGSDPNAPPTPPPFPPFTVGAWVANMAPQKDEQDRIYVLTRTHDPLMATPSQPPPQGSVQIVVVYDGTSQNKPTDKAGYAYFDFPANAPPTVPSVIQVTASYQGKTYQTTTFYTVLPTIASPTPGPGTPTVTPTPHP